MNVVIMSKVPLGTFYSYGSLYTPTPSIKDENGNIETQINLYTRLWSIDVLPNANYDFNLTGVYLKAGRGERNEQICIGQINFSKNQLQRFLKEDRKANLIIMGDFNVYPDSREMQILLEGKKGSWFDDPLDSNIFSHPSSDPSRRLDYMLPNANMLKEFVSESMKIDYFLSKKDILF